jgi:hypothetical protein
MSGRRSKILLIAAAFAAVLATAPAARAGMIPVSVSVQPDNNNFRWTYGVIVTTDVNVRPGDSFTIYDIGGMTAGNQIVTPLNWSVSTSMSATPPAGTSPHDDPTLPDLTFTYSGTDPIVGQAGLGNFAVISQFGDAATSDFTSTTHRQVDGRVENNITSTDVPMAPNTPPSETPEPATLALFGLGLPLAGLARFIRSRSRA